MATPNGTDPDEQLRKALRENARAIERAERDRERAFADRLKLLHQAQRRGWTQAQMAEAGRTTEGAVTQALRRARVAAQ